MIFATVGTTPFPFTRLLEAVDRALINLGKKEKLVVQKGVSGYEFKYPKVKVFQELPFGKMITFLRQARVVITHGGPATIFLALKYSHNLPLIVPRLQEFGEQVDNHQIFFAKFLNNKNIGRIILRSEEITKEIKNYLLEPKKNPAKREQFLERERLVKNLIQFTEISR